MNEPHELIIGKDIEIEKLSNFFPKNVDTHSLRVTNVSMYSVTKWDEANLIMQQILKYFPNEELTITDSTACIGGNSICFATSPQIKYVNAVELEKLHCDILIHNAEVFNVRDKINVVNDNYLDVKGQLTQDIIFHDFPWGGMCYREHEYIDLALTDKYGKPVSIAQVINSVKQSCRLQVIKVPYNFDFTNFFDKINFNKIKINRIFNKYKRKTFYYVVFIFS